MKSLADSTISSETASNGSVRPPRTATFQSIQVSRGLAALSVVFYHVGLFFFQKANYSPFSGFSNYGYMGVPYFFVLSGFIIGFAHTQDLGHADRLAAFVRKRFVRVYPIYWIFSALFIVAAIVGLGDRDFSLAPIDLLQAILLVHFTPEFSSPPLKVAWTLFYEVRFYFLFGLAILFPRIILAIVAFWIVAICMITPFNDFSFEILSFWNFAFPIGLLVCFAYTRLKPSCWPIALIPGLSLVTAILLSTKMTDLRGGRSIAMVGVMIGFGLVVLGLALWERKASVAVPRLLLILGDASYALYLVHSAVISVLGILILKLHLLRYVSAELLFLPMVVIATTAGIIAHLLIEKPVLRYTHR
ncbi:acyltransferase family protein [Sphingomonas sp. Leaf25]|uniref:acyltransferase family protein n=1 Tax=Sphingomonas sp. Leaf25 TaxID=1735692 RepID=UPI0009EC69EB|nr:acyltransferase [Sphingomonas sp. Leaf25]